MHLQFPNHSWSKAATALTALPALLMGMAHSANSAIAIPAAEGQLAQANTVVPASSIQQSTLYLNNDRAYSYNLEVEEGVTVGGRYLPPGVEIVGQYEPAEGGLRYDADAFILNGRSYPLNATSPVIEDVKDPRDTSTGSIAEDAGIGAAAGAILGEVFGDAGAGEIIGGAAAGAAAGNVTADRVVVIEPDQRINLY